MLISRRRFTASLATLAAVALPLSHAAPVQAADYQGPIKILVGFPPGGATDVVARLLSDRLKDILGQPIFIENRGGAGGMIATQQLKAAAPDGSTVMLTIDHSHVIVPLTFKAPGYDPLVDSMDEGRVKAAMAHIARTWRELADRAPDHAEAVAALCAGLPGPMPVG